MQKRNAPPFRYSRLGKWAGKTTINDKDTPNGTRVGETEIDLLAIDRGEMAYLVGECKYIAEPFTYDEYHKTRAKLTHLEESAEFYYALFSRSGFEEKVIAEAEANRNIQLFDLPQIVNYGQCYLVENSNLPVRRKKMGSYVISVSYY